MDNTGKNNDNITMTDLEEQTKVLLCALDGRFTKIEGWLDKRLLEMETGLRKDINKV